MELMGKKISLMWLETKNDKIKGSVDSRLSSNKSSGKEVVPTNGNKGLATSEH